MTKDEIHDARATHHIAVQNSESPNFTGTHLEESPFCTLNFPVDFSYRKLKQYIEKNNQNIIGTL
jgi:hypothetical protein